MARISGPDFLECSPAMQYQGKMKYLDMTRTKHFMDSNNTSKEFFFLDSQ